jgi:uncharacterized membrane protein
MIKLEKILKKVWFFIGGCILISFFLSWLVFEKAAPNFPVIFRSNDFGINFLGNRNLLWVVPILGMIFIGINFWLSQLLQDNSKFHEKNLSWLLFFANIGIAVLVLLISVQVYVFNL